MSETKPCRKRWEVFVRYPSGNEYTVSVWDTASIAGIIADRCDETAVGWERDELQYGVRPVA